MLCNPQEGLRGDMKMILVVSLEFSTCRVCGRCFSRTEKKGRNASYNKCKCAFRVLCMLNVKLVCTSVHLHTAVIKNIPHWLDVYEFLPVPCLRFYMESFNQDLIIHKCVLDTLQLVLHRTYEEKYDTNDDTWGVPQKRCGLTLVRHLDTSDLQ